jgi:enamidase
MGMKSLVIRNAGIIVSGDLAGPILDANTIVIRDGKIHQVGQAKAVNTADVEQELDANGAVIIPGLIDSHVHPVIGDFTPRQRAVDFIDSCLHGGVTSMISAGEVHLPGRPRDREGTKALAILAAKAFANLRPSRVKVHAGSVLLEKGLIEQDFAEMAAAGVRRVGEIGISGVHEVEEAAQMTRWAHNHNMKVLVHMGGASVPGSTAIGADFVLAVRPDVAAHVNGGPTAPSIEDVERIVLESDIIIELVQAGNVRTLQEVARLVDRHHVLTRVIVGTDCPSGTGLIPLGMLRTLSWIAALGGIRPEVAVCLGTGNTARVYGLRAGRIVPGHEADLSIVDAPRGSQAKDALEALAIGDTPSVAVVLIDGEVAVYGSRNTPPPKREIAIPWMKRGGH